MKPLWSWRQTVEVISRLSEETGARQESSSAMVSHFACWLNIESITCTKAS